MADMLDGIRVGDLVRTTARVDPNGTILFPIGTVARVVEIRNSHPLGLNFKLETPDDYWNYSRDMFEPINEYYVTMMDEIRSIISEIKSKAYVKPKYKDDDNNKIIRWLDIEAPILRYIDNKEESEPQDDVIRLGTIVKTTKERDCDGIPLFPVGTTGVIKRIRNAGRLPYMVESGGRTWNYSRDMFEIVPVKVSEEVRANTIKELKKLKMELFLKSYREYDEENKVFHRYICWDDFSHIIDMFFNKKGVMLNDFDIW